MCISVYIYISTYNYLYIYILFPSFTCFPTFPELSTRSSNQGTYHPRTHLRAAPSIARGLPTAEDAAGVAGPKGCGGRGRGLKKGHGGHGVASRGAGWSWNKNPTVGDMKIKCGFFWRSSCLIVIVLFKIHKMKKRPLDDEATQKEIGGRMINMALGPLGEPA